MAVRINPIPDDRAERMLADPAAYFAEARARICEQVRAEMEQERNQRKRRAERWRRP